MPEPKGTWLGAEASISSLADSVATGVELEPNLFWFR